MEGVEISRNWATFHFGPFLRLASELSWRWLDLQGTAAGSWSLGIVQQPQGEGCCWLGEVDWGCEGGDCGGKCLWRKARESWKQGSTAESCIEGAAITIASLSPHASISSWTRDSLAHQTPDALNYRVGPHPGWPFKWLMHRSTEEDPRRRSLLSAWMGRAMEKDWPKRPSDCQLPEAQKKTLIGP